MFSRRDLRLMRRTQANALPDRVTIHRQIANADGFGGWTPSDDPIATNVPARITEAQMLNFPGQGSREILVEKWTIRLPWGTDLRDGDIIEDTAGNRYEVDNVKARNWDTTVSAALKVVK